MKRTIAIASLALACGAFGFGIGHWVVPPASSQEAFIVEESARLRKSMAIQEELNSDPEYARLTAQVAAEKAEKVAANKR